MIVGTGGAADLRTEKTMKCVTVDFDKCTGLGICESLAPDFFEVNDDGELIVLKETIGDSELQEVEEAVAGCPTEALKIVDA
jgi:ferredoxin